MRLCDVTECGKKHYGRGLCRAHWLSSPDVKKMRKIQSDAWRAKLKAEGKLEHHVKAVHRRYHYGIEPSEFDAMLARQGGKCATCRVGLTDEKQPGGIGTKVCVDHCHVTNKVRGLLCGNCNCAIGHAKESPDTLRALARYLESSK